MTPAAIVTGGASGIGLAAAERLLDDGWPVAIIDADQDALDEAEDRFAGENAVFLAADITDEDEVAVAFDQAADALGPLGALVNAAGIRRDLLFEETSAELFRQLLDINLVGALIAAQAALERMADTLAIVNLSSVSALRANRGASAYGAARAGVKMLTEVMALELAGRGVRVNCVAPGPVDAPGAAGFDEQPSRVWLEHVPQNRFAAPAEIAAAIAFLLAPEAAHITGHTLVVDGGFSVAGILRED